MCPNWPQRITTCNGASTGMEVWSLTWAVGWRYNPELEGKVWPEWQPLCSIDNALCRLVKEINSVLKPIFLCQTTENIPAQQQGGRGSSSISLKLKPWLAVSVSLIPGAIRSFNDFLVTELHFKCIIRFRGIPTQPEFQIELYSSFYFGSCSWRRVRPMYHWQVLKSSPGQPSEFSCTWLVSLCARGAACFFANLWEAFARWEPRRSMAPPVDMWAADAVLNVLVAALKRCKGTGEINSDKIFYLTQHF